MEGSDQGFLGELRTLAERLVWLSDLRMQTDPPVKTVLEALPFTSRHVNIIRDHSSPSLRGSLNLRSGEEYKPEDLPEALAHSFWDGIVKQSGKLVQLEYLPPNRRLQAAINASMDLMAVIDITRKNFSIILGFDEAAPAPPKPFYQAIFQKASNDSPFVFQVFHSLDVAHETLETILMDSQSWSRSTLSEKIETRVAQGALQGCDFIYALDRDVWNSAHGMGRNPSKGVGSPPAA